MERRFLRVVTNSPDEYDLALSKAKITLAEFYAAILLELVEASGGDPRGDPQAVLFEATRDLNLARQRCLELRADLKADIESRQAVAEQFVTVFGREG